MRPFVVAVTINLLLTAGAAQAQIYSVVELGTLGGTASWATGINASGQVVGWSFTAGDAAQHAFITTIGGPMTDLGTLGGTQSYAKGINASGNVVGYANINGESPHAFITTNGSPMTDLGTFPGGAYSYALSLIHI